MKSLLISESGRVPYVRHGMFSSEWEAVGRILVKGFIDTHYFPTILSKSFVQYILFNHADSDDLILSYYQYLSNDERDMFQKFVDSEDDRDFIIF